MKVAIKPLFFLITLTIFLGVFPAQVPQPGITPEIAAIAQGAPQLLADLQNKVRANPASAEDKAKLLAAYKRIITLKALAENSAA